MNLILFEATELAQPLPRADRRARHILEVLRRVPGETFDVGLVNGARGKATLTAVGAGELTLEFAWSDSATTPPPYSLIVGLARPQTARDILRDATSLGVAAIHFVTTNHSEPSYARSTLWTTGEWRRHVLTGAEQAFDPQIPVVSFGDSLEAAIGRVPAPPLAIRLALDNYEAASALSAVDLTGTRHAVVALGAERGWSGGEREILRQRGFSLVHLGTRVLRTEVACIAALSILRAKRGQM